MNSHAWTDCRCVSRDLIFIDRTSGDKKAMDSELEKIYDRGYEVLLRRDKLRRREKDVARR